MAAGDRFDLERFVSAQATNYESALAEIRAGGKRSHWMWYVFPQIAGLGRSAMAQRYAIGSRAEAQAYLDHPLLGVRLRDCVAALADLPNPDPVRVFGDIDAAKLRSSLTLFEAASGAPLFAEALDRSFGGRRDEATMKLLEASEDGTDGR